MKLLKVKEVAEILNIAEQTVYRLIYDGKLKKTSVNSAVRIRKKEVERFINENTEPATEDKEDTKENKENIKQDNQDKKEVTEDKKKKEVINQLSLEEEPEYISTTEASQMLDKSKRTVQNYLNDDKLEGFKDGRNWKVKKQSVDKLLQSQN